MCDEEVIGFVSLLTDTIEIKKIRNEKTKNIIKKLSEYC